MYIYEYICVYIYIVCFVLCFADSVCVIITPLLYVISLTPLCLWRPATCFEIVLVTL